MVKLRKRGEQIHKFILNNVEAHPRDIVRVTSDKFGVTRQAINKHIKQLIEQETITFSGTTSNRAYSLRPLIQEKLGYKIDDRIQEDVVWRNDILPLLENLPDNVENIWNYCFSEIFNNAIDHSNGTVIGVLVEKTAITTEIRIIDDGEGIFKKIQKVFGLMDERHAVLELAKGKVTTDPENHSGEGIFFSSRMTELFAILSGSTFFTHNRRDDLDWISDNEPIEGFGTCVVMKMKNNAANTVQKIFNRYANPESEDYGFNKTVVPVDLVQYGDEMLVSRSQAKRLLARVDRFKTVILDFESVTGIGQAFADEIFRVFARKKPGTRIVPINMNESVQRVIVHVL